MRNWLALAGVRVFATFALVASCSAADQLKPTPVPQTQSKPDQPVDASTENAVVPAARSEIPAPVTTEAAPAATAQPPANPYHTIPERNPFRLLPEPPPQPEQPDEPPPPPPPPPIQLKLNGVTDMLGGQKTAILTFTEVGPNKPSKTQFLHENDSYQGVKILSIDLKKHAVLVDNHGQMTNVGFPRMESAAAPAPNPGTGAPPRPGFPQPPGQSPQKPNNAAVDHNQNQGGGSTIIGANDYDSPSRNTRGAVFVSGGDVSSAAALGGGSAAAVGSSSRAPSGVVTTSPSPAPQPRPNPQYPRPIPKPPDLPPWPGQ